MEEVDAEKLLNQTLAEKIMRAGTMEETGIIYVAFRGE